MGRFGIAPWHFTHQPREERGWHGHSHKRYSEQQHNHHRRLLRWAEGDEGERNESRNSCGGHELWKMPVFFQSSHRSLSLKLNHFCAGTRSARQGDNISRDFVLMNSRVSLKWVCNFPGRSIGMKSDFKETSPKEKSKEKANYMQRQTLRKLTRMKTFWCLFLIEESRVGEDCRAGCLWSLEMGPSGFLGWALWDRGRQRSSHKCFLPWTSMGQNDCLHSLPALLFNHFLIPMNCL